MKELLSSGVISREDKPTKWTSQAHFVPKPDQSVRPVSNLPPLRAASGHLMRVDGVLLATVNCAEYDASYEAELLVTPDLQQEFLISLEDMGSLGLL